MCFSRSDRAVDTADHVATVEERRADFVDRAMRFGCVMIVCIGIWLIGGAGYFWPGWVLLFGGLGLGKAAREAYGQPSEPALDDPVAAGATAESDVRSR